MLGTFNVGTDVNACDCTRRLYGHPLGNFCCCCFVVTSFFLFLFFFFFFLTLFTALLSPWDITYRKFGLPSLGKASCDRVALPNLQCMLGVLVFP